MASLIFTNGRYRIELIHAGRRRAIRFGVMKEKQATTIKGYIEALASAAISGSIPPGAAAWVGALDDKHHARLARAELVTPRTSTNATLGAMLDALFAAAVVKPATQIRMRQARASMEEHFGTGARVGGIDLAGAEAWSRSLKDAGYAAATCSRTVLYARQFFRWGMRRGFAKSNPFTEIKAGPQINAERSAFIDRETIAKVIDAAPDAEWRLLIGLSRFGGLRVPSEALELRWADVDLAANRMTVRSPKTEHHAGGAERSVPIFPELQPLFLEAHEAAPVGAVYVIQRYRAGANLITQFRRIIKRAGVKAWPRTWHNLRATRQTELASEFPLHTVCAWIGNSRMIAAGHYLQQTDADWQRATKAQQIAQHSDDESTRTGEPAKRKTPHIQRGLRVGAPVCATMREGLMGVTGLEPVTPVV